MKHAQRNILFSTLALSVSMFTGSAAQAEWLKSYGTTNFDAGSATPSTQGGYYLSMISMPASTSGKPTTLLSLLNASGAPSWTNKITTGGFDTFFMQEMANNRILLQGNTQASATGAGNPVWAMYQVNRATGALTPVFQKTYKGKNDDDMSVSADSQGMLWGTGSTTSFSTNGTTDMIVAKIDPNTGVPKWSKVYDYRDNDSVIDLLPVGSKFVLLANSQAANSSSQKLLVGQLSSVGAPIAGSFKEYGDSSIAYANEIKPISGGNYLVYGSYTSVASTDSSIFIMKLNSSLGFVWGKKYSGGTDQNLLVNTVQENADKSLTVTATLQMPLTTTIGGISIPLGTTIHPAAIRLSAAGAVVSAQSFEFQDNDVAVLYPIDNGGYLLGGTTSPAIDFNNPTVPDTDALYGEFNANIQPTWVKTLGGSKTDGGAIAPDASGYLLNGTTMSWGAGQIDTLVGKLDANGDVPGCADIKEADMTETSPTITASDLNWQAKPAAIVKKGAISQTNIALTVTKAQITTKTVCSN